MGEWTMMVPWGMNGERSSSVTLLTRLHVSCAGLDESKILILYCGGTLGMVRHPSHGYVPYPGFLSGQ